MTATEEYRSARCFHGMIASCYEQQVLSDSDSFRESTFTINLVKLISKDAIANQARAHCSVKLNYTSGNSRLFIFGKNNSTDDWKLQNLTDCQWVY